MVLMNRNVESGREGGRERGGGREKESKINREREGDKGNCVCP